MLKYEGSDRVLSRLRARDLTKAEYERVGAGAETGQCTFNPKTCAMDHDCEPPIGCIIVTPKK